MNFCGADHYTNMSQSQEGMDVGLNLLNPKDSSIPPKPSSQSAPTSKPTFSHPVLNLNLNSSPSPAQSNPAHAAQTSQAAAGAGAKAPLPIPFLKARAGPGQATPQQAALPQTSATGSSPAQQGSLPSGAAAAAVQGKAPPLSQPCRATTHPRVMQRISDNMYIPMIQLPSHLKSQAQVRVCKLLPLCFN